MRSSLFINGNPNAINVRSRWLDISSHRLLMRSRDKSCLRGLPLTGCILEPCLGEVLVRQFLGWFASLSTLGFVGRSGPGAWGTPTVDLQTAADGLYFALRWHVELDSQDEGLLHKSQSIQHHQRMFFGKCISEAAGQTCFVLSCLFVCCLCSLCWQMCYHHECL